MNLGRTIIFATALAGLPVAAVAVSPGVSPGPGVRYATDAYPGFDSEDELLKPSRKEPKLFGWINGPKKDSAAEQFEYAASLEAEESWNDARKAYDALVREWPTSPEAVKAQKAIADICLGKLLDSESAFAEYRYLLDFYSSQCDYDETIELMYKTAELMRDEGKRILFFRFDNTVDVRRAYEAVVLRAPGAKFAPAAMLTIASLREEEDKPETAATVYENLRSMYPDSPEATASLYREAKARMIVLRRCEYNRERVQDVIGFLTFVLGSGGLSPAEMDEVGQFRAEARALLENEAYSAARFYDSRTRTKRSAINAYQRFLDEYPTSDMAPEVRRRLFELQKEGR